MPTKIKKTIRKKPIIGVASFHGPHVWGDVILKESLKTGDVTIKANLTGLESHREYAWHIHEAGDLRGEGCLKACSHYNPYGTVHGGPESQEHHVGDLGNLKTNNDGTSHSSLKINFVKLRGKYSVIGRSLVIHEFPDDLGEGGTKESLKTGSAGKRIACAVIGYGEDSQLYF